MLDQYGREIRYLRVSVTDRCSLRRVYCMPAEGVARVDHGAVLSYEEIARITRLAAQLGVDQVRLTGGEPLVRKQFAAVTRRDELPRVLAGLEAALAAPGLNVKLNCVPTGENDDQLVPLAALARDRDVAVRFIELMPIGLGSGLPRRTEGEVLAILERDFGPARPAAWAGGAGPGRYVAFQDFRGKVGFISAMTHQFCSGCNRVRLTATGRLKACLQYEEGVDLKALLEAGAGDGELRAALAGAIYRKPAAHHFSAGPAVGDEGRNMNEIGG